MATELTAQQRANYFAMSTRQNLQMLATQTASSGATTLTFNLPKARLLSKILVKVTAKVKCKHATKTSVETNIFTPYRLIRRWSLDLNNGFQPFVISGEELAMYNMIHLNGNTVNVSKPLTCSSAGAENIISFCVEIPVTLNDRDPIGLILLQHDQTNVTLVADIANDNDFVSDLEGVESEITSITISPMLETFSIPSTQEAYPDLSILKLVTGRNDSMPSVGQQIIKLSTGTIYRRILFKVSDDTGNAFKDSDFTSNIELVFNQADINYSVSAEILRSLNERMYGFSLPQGMFAFDFAYQGITGLSGTRDYIDTDKLTEFWLRFNSSKKGKVEIVTECLSRLIS